MGLPTIKGKVVEVVAVGVAMVAVLILAGMTVAASIKTPLRASVISAAGFFEIYMLLWIVKQF